MMVFAADEDEEGLFGRTEYYNRQLFRKMKKKIAIERKVQASSLLHKIPKSLPNASGLGA